MIQTDITRLFNIKYPIIQGGLQGLGTSSLVSAIADAGGLGLITAGSYADKDEMMRDITVVKERTDKPFGVNLAIGIRKPMDEFVEGAIEAKVPIVFTSGNNPEKYMKDLKAAGIKVVHVSPSVRFAKKAESLGCDAVVLNGYECGGHPGNDDTTSLTLIQRARKELSIPIIAAGGFSTGRSVMAALALGASGVQMGTRFLLSEEINLHQLIKERLKDMQETDTIMVKKSIGKRARVMKTDHAIELSRMEKSGATFEEIFPYISGESYTELIKTGNLEVGIIALGQTIGLLDEVKSVENIFAEIKEEFQTVMKELAALNISNERVIQTQN